MFDPLSSWMRWNSVASAMVTNGVKMGEAWMSAGRVINHRLELLRTDGGSAAAKGELARMVPEKIAAFSQSGSAALSGWWAVQNDLMLLGQDMAFSLWQAQPPNAKVRRESIVHMERIADKMTKSAAAIVLPVHKTVTANDRRLKKSR